MWSIKTTVVHIENIGKDHKTTFLFFSFVNIKKLCDPFTYVASLKYTNSDWSFGTIYKSMCAMFLCS